MTATQFRKRALTLPQTVERSHLNHPDFRVAGRIFATLGYPNKEFGVVRLTRQEQKRFVQVAPKTFSPVNGAWGARGYTRIHLPSAENDTVSAALKAAWLNTAPKKLVDDSRR